MSLNLGLLDVFLGLDSAEHLGFASLLLSVTASALSFYESYLSQAHFMNGQTEQFLVIWESQDKVNLRGLRQTSNYCSTACLSPSLAHILSPPASHSLLLGLN